MMPFSWLIHFKTESLMTGDSRMYSPLNQSKTKLQLPLADMSEILMWLFKTSIAADLVLIDSLKMVRRENLWP